MWNAAVSIHDANSVTKQRSDEVTKSRKVTTRKRDEAPITPLRLPKNIKTVVVYGGSFDPPHEYHNHAKQVAYLLYWLEACTLYVPAARSPLKAHGPIASDEDRVAMLQLATQSGINKPDSKHCWSIIWTDEIDRASWQRQHGLSKPSYTIDTLRRLRKVLPKHVTIRLLIGSDQALSFHLWKDYRKVLRLATPLVMLREPTNTLDKFFHEMNPHIFHPRVPQTWSALERRNWASWVAPILPFNVSSTEARNLIPFQSLNAKTWHAALLMRQPVAEYIIKNRLYGVGTKYKPKSRKAARKR